MRTSFLSFPVLAAVTLIAGCATGGDRQWVTPPPVPASPPPGVPLPVNGTLVDTQPDLECWLDSSAGPSCQATIYVYTVSGQCYVYVPYDYIGVNRGTDPSKAEITVMVRRVASDGVDYKWVKPGIMFMPPNNAYFTLGQERVNGTGPANWVLSAANIPVGVWSIPFEPTISGDGKLCIAWDPIIGNGKSQQ